MILQFFLKEVYIPSGFLPIDSLMGSPVIMNS
jgi:hypothetical protein